LVGDGFPPFCFPQIRVSYTPSKQEKRANDPFFFSRWKKERRGTELLPWTGQGSCRGQNRLTEGKDDGWTEAMPQATVCGYGLTTDWQWAINHSRMSSRN
jgi:hypothetical protein